MSDDYPEAEDLGRIESWPYVNLPALMAFVSDIWSDYGFFERTASKIKHNGINEDRMDDGRRWCCATGGWSGNEEIIAALERNTMFWALCWAASLRGGYFEFEVKDIA
jgi:hypothetical protein